MSRQIEGWKAIASYVSARLGIEVTTEQVRHYARRADDALPHHKMGSARRPRIVAEIEALDAWAERYRTVWRGAPVMVAKGSDEEGSDG